MDRIRIRGGRPLKGSIRISGAKNAALPLLAASLLSDAPLTLRNLPNVADINTMANLLAEFGVAVSAPAGADAHDLTLHAARLTSHTAPYDLVRKMRASILVLGPLLAREGEARVSLPGGCAIGPRPVDIHLKALEQMGAQISLDDGYISARAPRGLSGAAVAFPSVSVGATENALMAATLAKGETVLTNAAREPEIVDLGKCLVAMGARIEGIGGDTVRIQGVDRLSAAEHSVLPDRIETGTFAAAAAITGGEVELRATDLDLIEAVVEKMEDAGVAFTTTEAGVRVSRANGPIVGIDVMTAPFPGFPTDMQAQIMAMMTVAEGASLITESIFENRFMHVPELIRMGANITVHGGSAMVRGVPRLTGAPVMATDLRASVSLVLAGLAAADETIVHRVYHLDRGYERIEQKLAACGADIERISGED